MSDVRYPEFVSHVLTQSSMDTNQYFQQRDFVEAYVEDDSDEALAGAAAAKECINRTLNRRGLHHYQKYTRGRLINQLLGKTYARCWWEQKTIDKIVGKQKVEKEIGKNLFGDPIFDTVEENVTEPRPVIDMFHYDVIEPRNIFMDNKYTYSLQEKDWIIIRGEQSLSDLLAEQEKMGYFNLDLLTDDEAPMKDWGEVSASANNAGLEQAMARQDALWNELLANANDKGTIPTADPKVDEFIAVCREAKAVCDEYQDSNDGELIEEFTEVCRQTRGLCDDLEMMRDQRPDDQ